MKRTGLAVAVAAALIAAVLVYWHWGRSSSREQRAPGTEQATPAGHPTGSLRARTMPLAAPDAVGTQRLEGQVIDEVGDPVARATVYLSSDPVRLTTTEEDGSFAFTGLVERTYEVGARADTGVAPTTSVRVTASTEPVILELRGGTQLEVHVVSEETKQPIVGAQVLIRGKFVERTESTDESGVAVLKHLSYGHTVVQTTAEGYGLHGLAVMIAGKEGDTMERTVELVRGSSVSGRVTDESGAPILGAMVSLHHPKLDNVFNSASTNASGEWGIASVTEGPYRASVEHADYVPLSRAVEVSGADRSPLLFTLTAGAVVAGEVVSADGAGVAHASVIVDSSVAPRTRADKTAKTDAGGRFRLKGLPRANVRLRAVLNDASSPSVEVDLSDTASKDDVVLQLARSAIAGVVRTSDGEVVPGAQVSAMPDSGATESMVDWRRRLFEGGQASDISDSHGRFVLAPLTPGSYVLGAEWPHQIPYSKRERVPAKTGDDDVSLTLDPAGTIAGAVAMDGGGVPKSFFVATSTFAPGLAFATPISSSARDGRFEISGLTAGNYVLSVSGPEFVSQIVEDIDVVAGEVSDVGTVTVDAGRRVSGRVVGPDGRGVAGATVVVGREIRGDASSIPSFGPEKLAMESTRIATTDEAGSFVAVGLRAEPLLAIADHSRVGRSEPVALGPTQTTLQLELAAHGKVSGRLTKNGEPVSRGHLSLDLEHQENLTFSLSTRPDGTFVFEKLGAGRYIAEVLDMSAPGSPQRVRVDKPIVVEAGQVTTVELELE